MSNEIVEQIVDMKKARRVSDIVSTIAVVDAMTQRGAFKGEELSTIGSLRDQAVQIVQLVENYEQEKAMEDNTEDKKSK